MKAFSPPGYRVPTGHCRYGDSRLPFRGPKRQLVGDYVLFLGGTDTYGKFIERPFPALLEPVLGLPCINMGCVNAGVDAYLKDRTVNDAARQARAVVMQVVGAHNLSNRFYTVHPRRNDRFLNASTVLQGLYPDVDFADYTFTRHLLSDLLARDPARFGAVREELRTAWVARMRLLTADFGVPVVLFWFADHSPAATDCDDPMRDDPLFVDASLIDELRDTVRAVVELRPSPDAMGQGRAGMVFPQSQAAAADLVMNVAAHRQAAATLTGPLRRILADTGGLPNRKRATQMDGPSQNHDPSLDQSLSVSSGTAWNRSATRP